MIADRVATTVRKWSVEPLGAAYRTVRRMFGEVVRYGMVGLVAFVVDVGAFNLLSYADASPLRSQPLTAKALSVVLATTVAFFGHRHWTFGSRGGTGLGREYTLFLVFSAIGLAIAVGCLAISHYLLDFTSVLADNISANGVGLVLGTAFRFWAYRQLVFPAPDPDRSDLRIPSG